MRIKPTLKERKERYREVIRLLTEGHTTTSAAKILGYSQPQISRIAKSLGFRKRAQMVEQVLLGKVKSSLVKRAVGYKTTKEYQQLDRNGNVVDLVEEIEVPGDVKAQLAYLQAKDKEGGWVNNNNGTSIIINQALQGVSTNDLLLTLRTGAEQLKAGGEGVPMVSGEVVDVDVGPTTAFSPTYSPEYDNYHEAKQKVYSPQDNFYDPNNGKLDEPVEGMLDNVGEDEEV
jgi:hypothetical protein